MKLQEIMTTRIEHIDADGSVYDAMEKMVDRRIRSLVIRFPGNDGNDGVITARDIVFKVFAKGINPRSIKVSDIASRPMVCVDQDVGLNEAVRLMEDSNIARVFICEGKKIVGVFTLMDVMAASLIMRARGDHVS